MEEGEIMGRLKIGDIALRILSVIIAIFLWVAAMNQNNPMQAAQVSVPVKLINTEILAQHDLVLAKPDEDFKAVLNVQGREKAIRELQAKPGSIVLVADLSKSANSLRKGTNFIPFEIKSAPADIKIPEEIQLKFLQVDLDEIVTKTLSVITKITPPNKPGYAAQGYTVTPAQVMVRGASGSVGSVSSVEAVVDASGDTTDVTKSVPIQFKDSKGNTIVDKNLSCDPPNVNVTIPIKKAKEVPVVVRTTGNLPQGVTFKGDIIPNPLRVSVTGDESIVNAINSIETMPVNLNGITQNTTRTVRISVPAGVTVLNNVQTVTVEINIERTISRTLSVPVTILNLPDGLKAELVTNNINVTLTGQESELSGLGPSSIVVNVDLSSAPAEDGEYVFTPQVTPPAGFNLSGYEPTKVRVKITRKQG